MHSKKKKIKHRKKHLKVGNFFLSELTRHLVMNVTHNLNGSTYKSWLDELSSVIVIVTDKLEGKKNNSCIFSLSLFVMCVSNFR